MTELTIHEIMYPYYRGDLLALVTNAITATERFEIFHARLLGAIYTLKADLSIASGEV